MDLELNFESDIIELWRVGYSMGLCDSESREPRPLKVAISLKVLDHLSESTTAITQDREFRLNHYWVKFYISNKVGTYYML